MPRDAWAALLAALPLVFAPGCLTASRVAYTPDELRRRVSELAPGLPAADLVVPYELPPEAIERARRAVSSAAGDEQRLEQLVKALFDPRVFGLRYAADTTTTGAEALLARRGNCVALASVFIGLARALGLDARYIDASSRVHETRYGDDGAPVSFGHVTAMVLLGNQRIGLDFARAGTFRWYQELDDLEALAHFYNNRGYELLDQAQARGEAPDWEASARLFRLATEVKPTFARAWNNLGIAAARLGRRPEAAAHYRRAMTLDPRLAAPRANLGALRLLEGDLPGALEALESAADLEPAGAHIQFQLAVARLRSGNREGAIRALRRTLSLREGYPGAEALLQQLAPAAPGAGGR
jgi:tetratricopeptide (TPR) repeat protein